jgi:nitrogen fixation protein NifZ
MIEPRIPRFEWGQQVRALGDLINDGSYPGMPADSVLVNRGETGEIVQVGSHTDSNTPVYLVEFRGQLVVGCFEEEIALVEAD